jgi:hypothetical protein
MSKLDKVAGMLAYAHYALQKHQFIEQWIKERGEPPSQESLRAIILSFRNENSVALDSLKQQSKTLLREYSEEHAFVRPGRAQSCIRRGEVSAKAFGGTSQQFFVGVQKGWSPERSCGRYRTAAGRWSPARAGYGCPVRPSTEVRQQVVW